MQIFYRLLQVSAPSTIVVDGIIINTVERNLLVNEILKLSYDILIQNQVTIRNSLNDIVGEDYYNNCREFYYRHSQLIRYIEESLINSECDANISILNSNTIEHLLSSNVLQSNVKLDPSPNNLLQITTNGIFFDINNVNMFLPKTFENTQVLHNTSDNTQYVFNGDGQYVISHNSGKFLNLRSGTNDILSYNSTHSGLLYFGAITNDRMWALPDASGTLALTSQLPDTSIFLPKTFTIDQAVNYVDQGYFVFANAGEFVAQNLSIGDSQYDMVSLHPYSQSIRFVQWQIGYESRLYANTTGSRNWYLPDSTGTLALTSELPNMDNYLAKTFTSTQILNYVDQGVFVFSAGGGVFATHNDTTTQMGFQTASGNFSYVNNSTGTGGVLSFSNTSEYRNWYLPNESGIIALTSQIPDVSNFLPKKNDLTPSLGCSLDMTSGIIFWLGSDTNINGGAESISENATFKFSDAFSDITLYIYNASDDMYAGEVRITQNPSSPREFYIERFTWHGSLTSLNINEFSIIGNSSSLLGGLEQYSIGIRYDGPNRVGQFKIAVAYNSLTRIGQSIINRVYANPISNPGINKYLPIKFNYGDNYYTSSSTEILSSEFVGIGLAANLGSIHFNRNEKNVTLSFTIPAENTTNVNAYPCMTIAPSIGGTLIRPKYTIAANVSNDGIFDTVNNSTKYSSTMNSNGLITILRYEPTEAGNVQNIVFTFTYTIDGNPG